MADVFNTENPVANPFDQLVGDGKKFKAPEDVAKGYLASQEHIERIERENAEFRSELATRQSVEDQLSRYTETQRNNALASQDNTRREETPAPKIDLDQRIREVLEGTEEKRRRETNIENVRQKMLEVYGDVDKAREAIMNRAREVGMTPTDIENIAARSPTAAFELLRVQNATPQTMKMTTDGTVNPQAMRNGDRPVEGSKRWWDQLKKDNPALYAMPDTQSRRMKDAHRLGDSFFD